MTRWLAAICFVVVLLVTPNVEAQANTDMFQSVRAVPLKGITTVAVEISEQDAEKLLPHGSIQELVQTDVEIKLRLAGLHVVTMSDIHKFSGVPFLLITIMQIKAGNANAASVDFEFLQDARLDRNGQFVGAVTTWSQGILFVNENAEVIRDKTKDLADKFVNDWLSVNPKK